MINGRNRSVCSVELITEVSVINSNVEIWRGSTVACGMISPMMVAVAVAVGEVDVAIC